MTKGAGFEKDRPTWEPKEESGKAGVEAAEYPSWNGKEAEDRHVSGLGSPLEHGAQSGV